MSTKAFVLLVVAILVLGGGLGGAFAGGVAVGKGQNEGTPTNSLPQPSSDQTQTPFDPSQLSQEQLQQIREQFLGQGGAGGGEGGFGGRGGFGGGGGLIGTIETIEGDTVVVDTPQGPLQAVVGADTVIQKFVEGTSEDLQAGIRVTVTGDRAEDGTVQARSILITPEGDGSFFGLPSRG